MVTRSVCPTESVDPWAGLRVFVERLACRACGLEEFWYQGRFISRLAAKPLVPLPAIVVVRFFQIESQPQLLVDLQIASSLPIIEEADSK
jgi:hypothetical protein